MTRRQRIVGVGALLGGAGLALAARGFGAEQGQAPPDLTGRWQLNEKESEDAQEKMREAHGRRGGFGPRSGGPGGRGGFGGPGGRRRPGGGGEPVGPGGGPPMEMREFFDPPKTLIITGNDAELSLDGGQGDIVRLHLDGRPYKREGGRIETKARWKDGSLVVESKTEGGMKLTTTYQLAPGTQRLEMSSRLEDRMGEPVSVRRVYDAFAEPSVPEGEASPPRP